MKRTVKVNELSVGMYVVRVTKTSGSVVMRSEGIIKSEAAISKLESLHVDEVEIDTSKSQRPIDEQEDSVKTESLNKKQDNIEVNKETSFLKEITSAQSMYDRALDTQRLAFETLGTSGVICVTEYESLAKDFFESITRNQEALLCMTKLQDKDSYLLQHSTNVAILLAIFCKHLGLSNYISIKITMAGLLHDMGKVKVPDEILFKKGKLSECEFSEMKKHPQYGADILSQSGVDPLAVQIALQHHERLSGSGYPNGLLAHQLNQYVRMSSIVDVFDAVTAERVYKPAMTAFQAFKIMKDSGASEYDGKLLKQFIQAIGLFSIGTVVLMASQKLAIVLKTNHIAPLNPTVIAFYHTKFKRHIEVELIDLSLKKFTDSIEKTVNPADFNIDLNSIIERLIINQ